MPLEDAGQDAVQMSSVRMLGCKVVPLLDRQVTEAMISSGAHSEIQPSEPHALAPTVLA